MSSFPARAFVHLIRDPLVDGGALESLATTDKEHWQLPAFYHSVDRVRPDPEVSRQFLDCHDFHSTFCILNWIRSRRNTGTDLDLQGYCLTPPDLPSLNSKQPL